MRRIAVCLFFLVPLFTHSAQAEQPPEFREAYVAYTDLVEQGKVREAIPYAQKALDIALNSDAFDDETRARLAFNLGYVNFQDGRMSAAAEAFTKAIGLLEKTGDTDLKAEALVYRGVAHRHLMEADEAKADLRKALEYLTGDHVTVQIVRAEALENLAWVYIMDGDAVDAQKSATEAYELYSKLVTDSHPRTINAMIAVSASAWLNKRRGEARDKLARALDMADKAGLQPEDPEAQALPGQFSRAQLLRFHVDVAHLYELMERRQDAQYHRNVVEDLRKGIPPASMRVTPVDRPPPHYPDSALTMGKTGWVIVQYTVRSDGSTKDIEIVDAAPKGYFEEVSAAAVKKWKYEPPTEEGKPVDVPGVRTVVKFRMEN